MLGHRGVRVQELNCRGDKGGPPPLCSTQRSLRPYRSQSNTECRASVRGHAGSYEQCGLLVTKSRKSFNRASVLILEQIQVMLNKRVGTFKMEKNQENVCLRSKQLG